MGRGVLNDPVSSDLVTLEEGRVWKVHSALYGLVTAPRDWSNFRDSKLPTLKEVVEMDGKKETLLLRPLGDANLWKVEKLGSSEVVGYMAVYVDDMMIASKPVTEAVAKMVRGQWSTSEPEYASNASMRFLGMDLEKVKDGYVLQELHPGTSWTAWGGKRVSLCSKSGGVVFGPTNTKKGERGSGPKNMDCMRPIRTMLRLNYVCLTWCSPAF